VLWTIQSQSTHLVGEWETVGWTATTAVLAAFLGPFAGW